MYILTMACVNSMCTLIQIRYYQDIWTVINRVMHFISDSITTRRHGATKLLCSVWGIQRPFFVITKIPLRYWQLLLSLLSLCHTRSHILLAAQCQPWYRYWCHIHVWWKLTWQDISNWQCTATVELYHTCAITTLTYSRPPYHTRHHHTDIFTATVSYTPSPHWHIHGHRIIQRHHHTDIFTATVSYTPSPHWHIHNHHIIQHHHHTDIFTATVSYSAITTLTYSYYTSLKYSIGTSNISRINPNISSAFQMFQSVYGCVLQKEPSRRENNFLPVPGFCLSPICP